MAAKVVKVCGIVNYFNQLWGMRCIGKLCKKWDVLTLLNVNKRIAFCLVIFFTVKIGFSQVPIGQWQEHLPYNTGKNIVTHNNIIYVSTSDALMIIDLNENTTTKLSKVNGLTETGINLMAKNESTGTIVIAYNNGNIDLLKDGKIINYSDIKRKNIIGDKKVYGVLGIGNIIYLSTGFGIVVLNEDKMETKDTYYIGANGSFLTVNNLTILGGQLYAATNQGLKQAPLTSNNLNNFMQWATMTNISNVNTVVNFSNQLLAVKNDSIYKLVGSVWAYFYHSTGHIKDATVSGNNLLVSVAMNSSSGKVDVVQANGTIAATLRNNNFPEAPNQALAINGQYWLADQYKGVFKIENNNFTIYTPNAPQSAVFGEMKYIYDRIVAAAGSVNESWNYQYNANGAMEYKNSWSPLWRFNLTAMDSMLDFVTLAGNSTTLYLGSFGGGLLQLKNGQQKVFKQSKLGEAFGDPNNYRVGGLVMDLEQNLWVSNYGAASPLRLLTPDETIYSFAPPFTIGENAFTQLITDDANQKWIVGAKGNGLICYNHGANIASANDDKWKHYTINTGNLPSNQVNCVVNDKDGILWVGTNRGVALIQCVNEVFTSNGCPAILPIVQNDQFAGFLFQNENVQSIAVDGANRKWVATRNGVWLISSGGEKIIYRFSEDNSPLLNNDVRNIAINAKTGEVFFATLKGVCSFRSTATEASTNDSKALVFPNPVSANFSGLIGIKNLPNNAIVKITDVNGRLVFQTKALGGQAVWDGKNYKGEKVHSGVYIVLATNEDSNEKQVAKVVITN